MPNVPLSRPQSAGSLHLLMLAVVLAVAAIPALGGAVRANVVPPGTGTSTGALPSFHAACEPPSDVTGPPPEGTQSISGMVTGAGGGALAGVQVRISAAGLGLAAVDTEPDGTWSMDGLGDGSYTISAFDGSGSYQSGFLGASGVVLTPDDAAPVVLSGGGATGVDIELPVEQYFTVSGLVTNGVDNPVEGIVLQPEAAWFPMNGCGTSDAAGLYTTDALRTGVYRVRVHDSNGVYPNGYYAADGFSADLAGATLVTVEGSDVIAIDIRFPPTYSLSGTVSNADADPIEGISIAACSLAGEGCPDGASDSAGSFTITGLVAGEYILQQSGLATGYLDGYYAGPRQFTRDAGDALPVTVGPDVTGIEVVVEAAPTASGRVTDSTGSGLEGMTVYLSDDNTGREASGVSGADGTYITNALQPGTYVVWVSDSTDPPTRPSGYRAADGSIVADRALADPAVVGLGGLAGLDVEVPDGGGIDVAVLTGGTPPQYASVRVCTEALVCVVSSTTDEAGLVSFPALLPGSYVVGVVTDTDAVRWYVSGGPAVDDAGSATVVPVTAGSTESILVTLPGAENTPASEDPVTVAPVDSTTGEQPATITFSSVQTGGTTSLTTSDTAPALPFGFSLGDPPVYFDITTTASFAGLVTVCLSYAAVAYADPAELALLHYHDGTWEDVTTSNDVDARVICGDVTGFSGFAVVQPSFEATGFFAPVDNRPVFNRTKAGSAIPVTFSLGGNAGLDVFAAESPGSGQVACTPSAPVDQVEETLSAGSSSLTYDPITERYTYVWKTSKFWADTCRELRVVFRDGTELRALFDFRRK